MSRSIPTTPNAARSIQSVTSQSLKPAKEGARFQGRISGDEGKQLQNAVEPGGLTRREAVRTAVLAGSSDVLLDNKNDAELKLLGNDRRTRIDVRQFEVGADGVKRDQAAVGRLNEVLLRGNIPLGEAGKVITAEMQAQLKSLGTPMDPSLAPNPRSQDVWQVPLGKDNGPGQLREGWVDAKKGQFFIKLTELADRGNGAWEPTRSAKWFGPFKIDGSQDTPQTQGARIRDLRSMSKALQGAMKKDRDAKENVSLVKNDLQGLLEQMQATHPDARVTVRKIDIGQGDMLGVQLTKKDASTIRLFGTLEGAVVGVMD